MISLLLILVLLLSSSSLEGGGETLLVVVQAFQSSRDVIIRPHHQMSLLSSSRRQKRQTAALFSSLLILKSINNGFDDELENEDENENEIEIEIEMKEIEIEQPNIKNLSTLLSRRSVVRSIAAATAIASNTLLGIPIIQGAEAAANLFDETSSSDASSSDASSSDSSSIGMIDYNIKDFSISLPNNWNIITKYNKQDDGKKTKTNPTLFSAIDFKSGTVVSVVQEEACSINEYAKSSFSSSSSSSSSSKDKNSNNNKVCDFVLTTTSSPENEKSLLLFTNETYKKDAIKLLIRHDDRDNAVLQGISYLDNCQLVSPTSKSTSTSTSSKQQQKQSLLELQATTTIPSGGTFRDTMGINQLNTIDRKVVAKAYYYYNDAAAVTPTNATSDNDDPSPTSSRINVISIWLSSPLNEWQNPSMNIKLNQIWDSVTTTTSSTSTSTSTSTTI
jgi:hypothetical protein